METPALHKTTSSPLQVRADSDALKQKYSWNFRKWIPKFNLWCVVWGGAQSALGPRARGFGEYGQTSCFRERTKDLTSLGLTPRLSPQVLWKCSTIRLLIVFDSLSSCKLYMNRWSKSALERNWRYIHMFKKVANVPVFFAFIDQIYHNSRIS